MAEETAITRYEQRIQALEAELDDMTAALAQAWDQLVPFLEAPSPETTSTLDVTPVLETIMAALDADLAALYICPRNGHLTAEWLTLPTTMVEPTALEAHMGKLADSTTPLVLNNIHIGGQARSQWLLMPVLVSHERVGAIGVGIYQSARVFNALDARTLVRMTDRVASQIVMTDLAESKAREAQAAHEMQIAGHIQQSLQPVTQIALPGVQVVGNWHPAASVGGDAWGQVQQDEDTLALFVLDVAGKGLPASLAAVSLHTALTTMLRLGYGPVNTVAMLNKQMYEAYTDAGIMATVAIARINARTGAFEQANAGHTPTLVRQQGAWQQWAATMPPLGVLPDFSPEAQQTQLQPGDLVIFYSDGFSEIETPDGLWGAEGLTAAVEIAGQSDAQQAAEAILQAAETLRGDRPPHDDQTLLNIYFSGSPMDSHHLEIPADFAALEALHPFLERLLSGASERARAEVMLAVHELCTNVVEHGYAGSAGTINITATIDASVLGVTVRDHAPNTYEGGDNPTAPDPSSLPEGGWGMFIIYQVMDDVCYTRHPDGNEWHLTRSL